MHRDPLHKRSLPTGLWTQSSGLKPRPAHNSEVSRKGLLGKKNPYKTWSPKVAMFLHRWMSYLQLKRNCMDHHPHPALPKRKSGPIRNSSSVLSRKKDCCLLSLGRLQSKSGKRLSGTKTNSKKIHYYCSLYQTKVLLMEYRKQWPFGHSKHLLRVPTDRDNWLFELSGPEGRPSWGQISAQSHADCVASHR